MSFREKSAWISFICLLLLVLTFFVGLHHHPQNAQGHLYLALGVVVGFVLLQVVLHVIVVAQSPKDERERFIELRGARIGFYSLVVGELTAMAAFHAHGHVDMLMWSILLAILIAWMIKLGSEIVLYRRG